MSSLFAELKRRNVIRIAGLYVVGAWLIVQVAGTVLPMFEAPTWLSRGIVVSALFCVIALSGAFAWTANLGGKIRHSEITTAVARGESANHD